MLYSSYQNNQGMSVNFDPVDSNVPPKNSLVQSSSPTVASSYSPSKKLSPVCKLIAFPSNNSAISSSLSVIGSDYTKKQHHQLNDQREYLDNCTVEHCTASTPSPSSKSSSVGSTIAGTRKSLGKNYSTANIEADNVNRLDKEWCSARKRQLDEILVKLQQLHKVNLDDRENIEGMKKKTIKLIATYSSITMKTNSFLTRWDRKYGFKLKAIQTSKASSSPSPPSSSSPLSPSLYDEKFEPNYLFNSTPIW